MSDDALGRVEVQPEGNCSYNVGEKCLYWLEKYGQYQHEQAIEEGWLDQNGNLTLSGLESIKEDVLKLENRKKLVEGIIKSGVGTKRKPGAGRKRKGRKGGIKLSVSSSGRRAIFGAKGKSSPALPQKSVSPSDDNNKENAQQSFSSMLRKLKKIRQAFIKEVKKMIRPVGGKFLSFKEEESQGRLRVRMPDRKGSTTICTFKGNKEQIKKALAAWLSA